MSIRTQRQKRKKVNTHTQVERSDFRDSANLSETIETNWSRDGLKLKSENLRTGCTGCKIEAQCKGGVTADSVSSLIIAAGERRGLLGVEFENMMRSWVIK